MYHVLNRANGRATIFRDETDYLAFERVMTETIRIVSMPVFTYILMPNHWHLVLRPHEDGDLAKFMLRLTTTHAGRLHRKQNTTGQGHIYQGPYKCFPVQEDRHCLTLCRYVERNAKTANLVQRAEDWRWSGLAARHNRKSGVAPPPLAPWPVRCPPNWIEIVNKPFGSKELEKIRQAIARGRPFGDDEWSADVCRQLGLDPHPRPRGRPPRRRESPD